MAWQVPTQALIHYLFIVNYSVARLKSGMPAETEMPAPAITTILRKAPDLVGEGERESMHVCGGLDGEAPCG